MGRNIQDIINELPAGDRARVRARSREIVTEMLEYAQSLDELRKAAGQTQADLAQKLGVKQHAISQLERRTDLYLSTLNKYVGALGHRLELSLVTASGERVQLPHFRPWEAQANREGSEPASNPAGARRGGARKSPKPDRAHANGGEGKKKAPPAQRKTGKK